MALLPLLLTGLAHAECPRAAAPPPGARIGVLPRDDCHLAAPAAPSPPVPLRWYGWQTLAVDAATWGAALSVAGVTRGSPAAAVVFASGYAFGAPVVHVLHQNYGRAGLSLALRLALPVMGGVIGHSADDCGFECNGDAYMALGVLLGYVGAVALDASAIAWEPKPVAVRVTPAFGAGRRGAWMGFTVAL